MRDRDPDRDPDHSWVSIESLSIDPTEDRNAIIEAPNYGNCPSCGLFFQSLHSHRCVDLGPPPLCRCGCGERVTGTQKMVMWSHWVQGHSSRGVGGFPYYLRRRAAQLRDFHTGRMKRQRPPE